MRRRIMLATSLVLLALVAGPATHAGEWSDALRAYKRDIKPENATPQRIGAVRALGTFGTREAARVLLDTVGDTEKTERPLIEEKDEVAERIKTILGSQQFAEKRVVDSKVMEGLKSLQARLAVLQQKIVAEARVRQEIAETLVMCDDPKAVKYLMGDALRSGSRRVREIAATALGAIGDPNAVKPLRRLLNDKAIAVRSAALLSLGEMRATLALPDILKRLEDKAWPVRAAAVTALGMLRAKEAVGPLIDAMEREEGRLQKDIANVLEDLTGQRFGVNVDGWRRWWKDHAAEFGGDAGGKVGGHGKRGGVSYYGIETFSKRIVYVIDVSGSMNGSHASPGRQAEGNDLKKVDAAKRELIRSLKTIPKKGRFSIVVYNDMIKVWSDKLVAATTGNKKKAESFVNGLNAAQSTNIYGALEAVFRMAGMGANDKHYDLAADTIFLLSDGSPTKPDGSMDSTEKIIVACREWNRLKRVTIHCIGIGKAHNAAFMSQLARENGGQYVAR